MIYNLVSCKRVIAKVMTDLDLQEGNHRITDMIEYIGSALKMIGAFPQMVTKVAGKEGIPSLKIHDYQVKLPEDLYTINQVAYSHHEKGPWYPVRYSTGSFSFNHAVTNKQGYYDEHGTYIDPTTNDENLGTGYPTLSDVEGYRATSTEHDTIESKDLTYNIVPGGWLKINSRHGHLMISYQAIPVDEDFFPMVPDDEAFLEALYWYINMKITYPEWKAGRVRDAVYYDTKSSWNYYRKQAYGNAMMPNSDQLESIKNVWLRLVPLINEEKSFFSTMSEQEHVRNQDRR